MTDNEKIWYADDGNAAVEIVADTARAAAEQYVTDGTWDDGESFAVRVHVWRGLDDDGDRVDESEHVIVVHPPEPTCSAADDGAHRWTDSPQLLGEFRGVRGLGGAAIQSRDVCAFCGLERVETSPRQGRDLLTHYPQEKK